MNEQSIFIAALERDPAERRAFLDGSCRDNPELRQRVEKLLGSHEAADSFMGQPAGLLATTIDEPLLEKPGSMIGPYKLREVLGEGGMGIVYVAEQEKPIRRKVALKVIKPGMDTREVIARFEAERQALALMNHPNIAKVHDAGTTESGRPYFVMELVPGLPVTDYCNRVTVGVRERLKLFIQVCQAVQHAHQKGVIHRDLKPSNVMVTMHDGTPVPKVIDFGVAKAINQRLTEHTVYTRMVQMVGTPMYMSPEQAELSSLGVDTRSDVYSLGVLLYELLTGTTPFDKETLSNVGFDEMRRIIREDAPPRPSQRVSTLEAQSRSTVSGQRGIDERQLVRALHGDLDWIVMKALEKDRNRRYESADAFAADLQRYLDDKPVEARPPSVGYRLQKFVRRQRRALSTAAILAVCGPLSVYALYVLYRGTDPGSGERAPVDAAGQQIATAGRARLPARASGRELPGLVPEPLLIPEVGRWQLITKKPRGVLRSAVWSPDEKLIALGEANHVRIYDATNVQLLHVLVAHNQPVTSVAWHPDGSRLASASEDGMVRLWASDGVPTHILEGHSGPVYKVAWRPDGEQLASAAADGTVRLWNVEGKPVRVLDEAGRHVFGIDWSPDGKQLASAGGDIAPAGPDGNPGDNSVYIWDAETGVLVRKIDSSVSYSGLCVDWRPDGKQLAVGYGSVYRSLHNTGTTLAPIPGAGVRLWKIDGSLDRELIREPGSAVELGTINAVAWEPTGKRLAFGGRQGVVRLWNADDQSVSDTQAGNLRDLSSISWKQNGSGVLTTSRESVREWNADQRETELIRGLSELKFERAKWSPDGKAIAAKLTGNDDRFWSADGKPAMQPDPPAGNVPAWWLGENRTRRPDGTPGPTLEGTVPTMRDWAWNKNGWIAGAAWADASVRIWNDQGKLIATLKDHRGGVESVSWSADGEMLASGGGDSVRLWKSDGSVVRVITGHTDEVYAVAWSPDGKWLASAGSDSMIRLWKLDGTHGPVFRGHQGGIHDIAWSPDSKRIASASWLDSTLRVWNVETGKTEWQALKLDTDAVVTLSPSGQPLHGERGVLESGLLYLVEKPNGATDLLTFGDFRKRYAKSFIAAYAGRFTKSTEAENWDQSEAAFADAITFLSDGNAKVRTQIADIGSKLSLARHANAEFSRAEQTIKKTIDVRQGIVAELPDDPDRIYELAVDYKELGWILVAAGRDSESRDIFSTYIEILRKLLDAAPENARYRERSYVVRALGSKNCDEAFNDLTKALELRPKPTMFVWDVVRWSDGLLQGQRPGESSPQGPETSTKAKFELVKAVFLEAIRRSPEIPQQFMFADWLTTAPEDLRDPELALQLARRAVELSPEEPMRLQSLAWALYRSGDYRGSIETIGKNTSAIESDFVAAMVNWRLGNQNDARACFDRGNVWLSGYLKSCRLNYWKNGTIYHPTPAMMKRLQAEAAEVLGLSK